MFKILQKDLLSEHKVIKVREQKQKGCPFIYQTKLDNFRLNWNWRKVRLELGPRMLEKLEEWTSRPVESFVSLENLWHPLWHENCVIGSKTLHTYNERRFNHCKDSFPHSFSAHPFLINRSEEIEAFGLFLHFFLFLVKNSLILFK